MHELFSTPVPTFIIKLVSNVASGVHVQTVLSGDEGIAQRKHGRVHADSNFIQSVHTLICKSNLKI